MDVEGSGRRLIYGTIPAFAWRDWGKPQKASSRYPAYGPRLETETSRVRSRSARRSIRFV